MAGMLLMGMYWYVNLSAASYLASEVALEDNSREQKAHLPPKSRFINRVSGFEKQC